VKDLGVNPVRNSSGALNPAGILLKRNPAAEQRGIISNGVNSVKGVNRIDIIRFFALFRMTGPY